MAKLSRGVTQRAYASSGWVAPIHSAAEKGSSRKPINGQLHETGFAVIGHEAIKRAGAVSRQPTTLLLAPPTSPVRRGEIYGRKPFTNTFPAASLESASEK